MPDRSDYLWALPYRNQITELRQKIRDIQAAAEPEIVPDHAFATPDGTTHLSDLFGSKDALFVIHNMGVSCPYCTLWADGFNGIYAHVADRAAFVVCSPDTQSRFAAGRGWRFPMVRRRPNITASGRNPPPIVMARLVRATYTSTVPRRVARTSRAMTIGGGCLSTRLFLGVA